MSRQAVNAHLQVRGQNRYLRLLTLMIGYNQEFFQYKMTKRPGGAREQGLCAGGHGDRRVGGKHPPPLPSIVTGAGLLGAVLNLIYALSVVVISFTNETTAAGWTTLR